MAEQFVNNAASTLDGGIDGAVTSLDVADASTFPNAGDFRILIDDELMLVTGVSGDTFTVTRGIEDTAAAAHSNGVAVTHILTAGSLQQIIDDNSTTVTSSQALCSADTTFNSSTWTDVTGCSLSLAAGTYLIIANIQFRNNGGGASTGGCKIYYGSTDLIAGEYSMSAGFNAVFTLQCRVVLGSTQTVKIAGIQQGAVDFQAKRYGDYDIGAVNIPGTNLVAIKLE